MTVKDKGSKNPAKKAKKSKSKAKPKAKTTASKAKANAPIVGDRPANKKLDPKPKQAKTVDISPLEPSSLIVTLFSIGRIPLAPGTWGSLFAVVLYPIFLILPIYAASTIQNIWAVAIMAVAILVLLYSIGVIAIRSYQAQTGVKDGGEIVYDEFFGQILTYSLITAFYVGLAHQMGVDIKTDITPFQSLIFQFVPFFAFRLFDIAKPWPIWVIDKQDNRPSGVMLDDVVAAIYAATASIAVFFILDAAFPNL